MVDDINEVEEIVKKVNVKIISKPLQGKDPVGFEQRIEEVKSLLDMKPDDDTICMLGIYGLGGIGKTEIAKALYSKIVHGFEAAIFIANVREKSNKINGLEDLQMSLLSNMSGVLETELSSTSRGIYEIKRRLGKKKALLVLDDVDDIEQLNNLAGGCDWFGLGSRIIITTRDGDLLRRHRVEKTYKMMELNDQQSLELFCQNAFGKSHPKTGYEDMSYRVVKYARGLPLVLKVLGTDLAIEDNLEYWEYTLEECKRNPNPRIKDVLQRSYERLQSNAKQVFLDIAFFFKGERIEYVEMILKEFNATQAIKVLVLKSLITVEDGRLNMNGHIQDMAREIVRGEAPNNPGKRSRLWSHEDVTEVLTQDLGSDSIEGIILDPLEEQNVEWSGTAFKKMRCLRILIVRNTSFSIEPKHLPAHLTVLDWNQYPSKSFPPEFHPKNIIVFNLWKSSLTLRKTFQKFSSLTTMNFSCNETITTMPNVSGVPNLREIRLDHCENLIKVDESVVFLQKLAHLSASGCYKLREFPRSMYLPSLEVLNLSNCSKLEHFPDIVNKMNQPLKIYMTWASIEKLPDSICNLTGLVFMDFGYSEKLKYLPHSLFMLPNLVTFKIGLCSILGEYFRRFAHSSATTSGRSNLKTLHLDRCDLSDKDLHAILICFPKLEDLSASFNNFVSLPACINEFVHLTSLNVKSCKKLEEITELPSTIQKVNARDCCHLATKTLDMLWSQVKKGIPGLEVVMSGTKIPEWFDFKGSDEGNPCFWARGKFPIVALALFFNLEEEQLRSNVELHLVINEQRVPSKGNYKYKHPPKFDFNHVFCNESQFVVVCDLRLLFSKEEWLGLDAFVIQQDWNLVQVSIEGSEDMKLSSWGVHVYKQETKMEDVRFMCPDKVFSDIIANTSSPTAAAMHVLSMEAHEGTAERPSRPTVASSSDDDALLQALVMKKDESCESDAKHKMKKIENETDAAAPDELDIWKHEYHDLLDQLNISNSKLSALSGIEMQRESGKEGCKSVTKHEKLASVLKGIGEELQGIYDAGIEGFQKSQEFKDLMSAVYLKGVRDGVLKAHTTLLALDMDRITTPDEHVTDDDDDFDDSEILDETTLSPTGSQVDNPGDTSYLSRRHRIFRRFFKK
ncbi:TMV resistance protein N-like [Lotus japonicus]|uniref:TMV resistance protein N-like n=1 Tax=Lotus japonicus TaxID=34305 RepID=UPI00258D289F|nr:TMV resistance protein N-like [Lotus japonicus]